MKSERYLNMLYRVAQNLSSKRTWVFAVATFCMAEGLISSGQWFVVTLIYLGDKVSGPILDRMAALRKTDSA